VNALTPIQIDAKADPFCATVAALYVAPNGTYFGLPDVDAWDEARDARAYDGPHPVVAHPPCQAWCQLSAVNSKRWGSPYNEDGGCFAAALQAVRLWGGVLEHPAESRAFAFHRIPEPAFGAWQRTIDGDWVTEVWQSAYGHLAKKRTWLLYSGDLVPHPLAWNRTDGTHQIGFFDRKLPQLPIKMRSATPPAFRDLLLLLARTARHRKEMS